MQKEIAALKASNAEKRKQVENFKRKYEQLSKFAEQLKEKKQNQSS